jgi:hypothetical protein
MVGALRMRERIRESSSEVDTATETRAMSTIDAGTFKAHSASVLSGSAFTRSAPRRVVSSDKRAAWEVPAMTMREERLGSVEAKRDDLTSGWRGGSPKEAS